MKIKGLENYEVFFDEGVIKVWSLVSRKWIKKKEGSAPGFCLCTDGATRHFSPGFLRFLMLHPDMDARHISPTENRIKFAEDGTVMDLYGEDRKKRYSCFRDVDDAIATVILMKSAESGDLTYIYMFVRKNRNSAIWTVARLLKTTPTKVMECVEDGEERFIKQLTTAHCESIIPLYAWLCRCIKTVVLEKRRLVSVEGKKLESKKCMSVEL